MLEPVEGLDTWNASTLMAITDGSSPSLDVYITLANIMGSRLRPPIAIPLELPTRGCWVIAQGEVEAVSFFGALPVHFSEASTVFIEGTTIETAVVSSLERFVQPGKYLPKPQTLSLGAACLRYAFSKPFCAELARLADNHATPELFDHLFIYAGEAPLIEWPDAFANSIWISFSVSQERVAAFAQHLGLPYGIERVG